MIKCKSILFCLLFLIPVGVATGQEVMIIEEEDKNKWYKPDYFKVQYAGNIGFISIGLGYEWWREYAQLDLLYGFVPYNHGEAVIHTFTMKNTFSLYKYKVQDKYTISPTLGFSISFEPGENSYMRVPDKFPDGYYSSNSFYACLNAGLKSNFEFKKGKHFSGLDVFFEVNTLADYLYYSIVAQEDWEDDIFSFALGVNVFF